MSSPQFLTELWPEWNGFQNMQSEYGDYFHSASLLIKKKEKKRSQHFIYRENLVKTYKLSGRPKNLTTVNEEDTSYEPGARKKKLRMKTLPALFHVPTTRNNLWAGIWSNVQDGLPS